MKKSSFNKKPKNKKKKTKRTVKKTLRIIGTIIFSLILIVIITGSILATALTVYVVNIMDKSDAISLDHTQYDYSTFLWAKDENGEYQKVFTLTNGEKRIWVDIESVPQHVQDAFVYTEDERFYNHDGVDFKRTFSAFANLFLHFYDTEQGASTITQQLVRNITGDTEKSSDRKIREIFRAMNLEKAYTKTDILEAYLNYVPQGGTITGIQAAANFYFDKDISELTIAEAACLAAIPKDPPRYRPTNSHPEYNEQRREYVLYHMYDNGAISTEEYDAALNEELHFVGYNKIENDGQTNSGVSSYFVDAAIEQVTAEFMELYGLDHDNALLKLKSGGYNIYLTVDMDIQTELEAKYNDPNTFTNKEEYLQALEEKYINPSDYPDSELDDPPQSACIIYDYSGNVLGVVGGIGQKTQTLGFNRATQAVRSPGSCIKPIASYGPAIELDLINFSTMIKDEPLEIKDNATGQMIKWPSNYSGTYSGNEYPTYYMLKKSMNTAAAQIIENYVTPKTSYDFLTQELGFTTLVPTDIDRSPMSVGGLTNGVILEELVASYQIFGNLGKYNEPTFYSLVTDAEGTIVLEHDYIAHQAMDSDSAYIMNRMMKRVVDGSGGTGVRARKDLNPQLELVGKTGTSQDWGDILFVGCTPDYVAGMWYGYDEKESTRYTYYSSAQVWNNIFKNIVDSDTSLKFEADPGVVELPFCSETGLISNGTCPEAPISGYYKISDLPTECPINHPLQNSTSTEETTTSTQATTPAN